MAHLLLSHRSTEEDRLHITEMWFEVFADVILLLTKSEKFSSLLFQSIPHPCAVAFQTLFVKQQFHWQEKKCYNTVIIPCLLWPSQPSANLLAEAAVNRLRQISEWLKCTNKIHPILFPRFYSWLWHVSLAAHNPFKSQMSFICSKPSFFFSFWSLLTFHYLCSQSCNQSKGFSF